MLCFRYCVRLYRSEALVALDKIADAVSYLNPDQVMSINCLRKTGKINLIQLSYNNKSGVFYLS